MFNICAVISARALSEYEFTRRKAETIHITFRIGFIFVDVCGIILHLLLLSAFVKDPLKCFKLRMSFVINLAIFDFLVCLFSLFMIFTRKDEGLSSVFKCLRR